MLYFVLFKHTSERALAEKEGELTNYELIGGLKLTSLNTAAADEKDQFD